MVLLEVILLCNNYFGHSVPGKIVKSKQKKSKRSSDTKLQTRVILCVLPKQAISHVFFFFLFPVDILLNVSLHRVLPHQSTGRSSAIQHVLGHLSVDLVRRAVSGSRRRCCDERAERRVPGAGDVGTVPSFLRVLRQLRRDSGLPKMDHLSQLHQIRLRRNRTDYLRLRSGKAEVFSGKIDMTLETLMAIM